MGCHRIVHQNLFRREGKFYDFARVTGRASANGKLLNGKSLEKSVTSYVTHDSCTVYTLLYKAKSLPVVL